MTLTDVIAKVTRYAKRVIVTDNSSSDAVRITQTGSGNALVVQGKVGVGTTATTDQLEVNGSIKGNLIKSNIPNDIWVQTSYYGVGNQTEPLGSVYHHNAFAVSIISNGYRNNSGNWETLNAGGFTGASSIQLFPNGNIEFGTQANKPNGDSLQVSKRLLISNTGDVGINTTTPSSKLHVNGDLTVQSATTSTTVGAAGAASALPATPEGYLVININGTARKIPFYNV
jgi:hypothetical protein